MFFRNLGLGKVISIPLLQLQKIIPIFLFISAIKGFFSITVNILRMKTLKKHSMYVYKVA